MAHIPSSFPSIKLWGMLNVHFEEWNASQAREGVQIKGALYPLDGMHDGQMILD